MAYDVSKDYRIGQETLRDVAPGRECVAITASGSDLSKYVRSLWISTAGTVTGIPVQQGADTTFNFAVAAGTPLNIAFRRITACPAGTIGVL